MTATMYIRRNGYFGSSCDGCQDTGHTIFEDSGLFTVYSVHHEDQIIAKDAPRNVAEDAIAADWREAPK